MPMGAASRKSGLEKHLALKIGNKTTRKVRGANILELNAWGIAMPKNIIPNYSRHEYYPINSKLGFNPKAGMPICIPLHSFVMK